MLGEAETGGTDGHNAGLEAGSRSWSMERDMGRHGGRGETGKRGLQRREIRRENRKHRARERQTEVQGGMVSGAREEEGFGGREERAGATDAATREIAQFLALRASVQCGPKIGHTNRDRPEASNTDVEMIESRTLTCVAQPGSPGVACVRLRRVAFSH